MSLLLPTGTGVIESNGMSRVYYIVKARGSGNVIITPNGSDTIDGSSTLTLSSLKQGVMLQYYELQ